MQFESIPCDQGTIAVVTSDDGAVIRDAQSALDLLMAARYEADADRIAIAKELIADDFFILSTGMAGEILQKYVNSHYTSKPLHDFIYESNKGRDFFFVESREEALRKLAEAR